MNRKVITIDGPSGSGKSTVAKLLSERLGWSYLDSGAIYRLVAYKSLNSDLHKISSIFFMLSVISTVFFSEV